MNAGKMLQSTRLVSFYIDAYWIFLTFIYNENLALTSPCSRLRLLNLEAPCSKRIRLRLLAQGGLDLRLAKFQKSLFQKPFWNTLLVMSPLSGNVVGTWSHNDTTSN